MILADTSAWVEYDRASGSLVDRRIEESIAAGGYLAITEPVMMEILAGARNNERERDLRALLFQCQLLAFDATVDFEGAARIYRRCRGQGVTPRGMVDCMISAVALRYGASLLTCDRDMVRVAEVVGVELDVASLGR